MGKRTNLPYRFLVKKYLQHPSIPSISCGAMPKIVDLYIIQMIDGSVNLISHKLWWKPRDLLHLKSLGLSTFQVKDISYFQCFYCFLFSLGTVVLLIYILKQFLIRNWSPYAIALNDPVPELTTLLPVVYEMLAIVTPPKPLEIEIWNVIRCL